MSLSLGISNGGMDWIGYGTEGEEEREGTHDENECKRFSCFLFIFIFENLLKTK